MTLAAIIHRFGDDFAVRYHPNAFTLHVLHRLILCKTAAMGGHTYHCESCGHELVSYNSCKNRHCPACKKGRMVMTGKLPRIRSPATQWADFNLLTSK